MRILELCAGYGGLGLGLQIAIPSARVVGVVERQAYCVARWQERMEATGMEPVAIWPDLDSFAACMAERNRGRLAIPRPDIDCITAGFPCQPFSTAGKRRGVEDHRWVWPVIRRIIGVVGPQYVFLENVPGLLTHSGGFGTILGDLAALGFDVEWDRLPAADAGANHYRFRVWILAYAAQFAGRTHGDAASGGDAAHGASFKRRRKPERLRGGSVPASVGAAGEDDGNSTGGRLAGGGLTSWGAGFGDGGSACDVPHADTGGADAADAAQFAGREPEHAQCPEPWQDARIDAGGCGGVDAGDAIRSGSQKRESERSYTDPQREAAERAGDRIGRDVGPAPSGVDDGTSDELGEGWWSDPPYAPEEWLSAGEPDRAEQLHALGNGVVPLQAALAFTLLARRAGLKLC